MRARTCSRATTPRRRRGGGGRLRENLIDVNNAQQTDFVMANLKEKILGQYFAVENADTVSQDV